MALKYVSNRFAFNKSQDAPGAEVQARCRCLAQKNKERGYACSADADHLVRHVVSPYIEMYASWVAFMQILEHERGTALHWPTFELNRMRH